MRYAFFGTPPFSAQLLQLLLDAGLRPEFVVTQPDAASRRGHELWPSAVAEVATQAGLPLEKPDSFRDPTGKLSFETRLLVETQNLDCVILAAYGKIIPSFLLSAPRQGWINLHTSLLPRWRGAAPIQRAILTGDEATGVSVMRMADGLDVGPYCAQAQVHIGDKDLAQLEDVLATKGAELLLAELPKIIDGTATWQKQDEALATYATKIGKHELDLSAELSAEDNARHVRASSDSAHACLTLVCGNRDISVRALHAKLWPLAVQQAHRTPGTAIVKNDRLVLICASASACCVITRLQPAGKRPQDSADFLHGLHLNAEESLLWR
ncbi:MAG: methionyl-tRNA formyltransferase [Coriobacteriia bacterium]|nr:methionyl-tRNA formyltransferase [Coriobacteriia bacterium]